jgi:hypothetical protein
MAYSQPDGDSASFVAGGTLRFPPQYSFLSFKFKTGSYVADDGDDIEAQFPLPLADYVRPLGDAANFTDLAGASFDGAGVFSVDFTVAGVA